MAAKCDLILGRVYAQLGLQRAGDADKYARIDDIIEALARRHRSRSISGVVTGAISERLCRLALDAYVPNGYNRLPKEWRWLGDYSLHGAPFNTVVSVKSFKAKERLLASGSGSLLMPTLGFGFFDDAAEWSPNRLISYQFRGFLGIYVPGRLLEAILPEARSYRSSLGRLFLRNLADFGTDLRAALTKDGVVDPRLL